MYLVIKLFIALFMLCSVANATTYYVRPSAPGSDSNDGLTYATAFLTPSHGCSVLVAGDTLKVAGDGLPYTIDYNAPVSCSSYPGSVGNPITFEAYDTSDPPLISWKAAYTGGWTNTGTNLWTSTAVVEGSNQDIQGFYKYDPTTGSVTVLKKEFSTGAVDAEGDFYAYKGTSPAGKVLFYSATDPNTYTGEFRSITGAGGVTAHGLGLSSYYRVNYINTIFTWIGFNVSGVSTNIVFNNCSSEYGINRGFSFVGSDMTDIEANNCQANHGVASSTTYSSAPDLHGFKIGSSVGAFLDASNIRINNFTAIGNGYHGIQVSNGSGDVTITGGLCHTNDQTVPTNIDGACVRFGSDPALSQSGYEVSGVECYDARNCITLYGDVNNVKIHDNYFHDYRQAGIYYDTASGTPACPDNNCLVYNNIFYDSTYPAFYLDDVQNLKGYNNTIINSPLVTTLANSLYSISGILKNNVVIVETGQNLMTINATGLVTSDYNAFYSPDSTPFSYNSTSYNFTDYKAASSQDANSINTDFTSDFTNYAGGDYSLKSTATIKDLGTTLSDVTDDYIGTFRPQGSAYAIGAYEEAGSGGGTGVRGMSITGMVVN